MRVWGFVSQKGGSGKSLLTSQISVYAAQCGEKVLVVDIDPQASAALWSEARGNASPQVHVVRSLVHKLGNVLAGAKATGAFSLVLIDTAPHTDGGALATIKAADLVVVPTRPSSLDLGAIRDTAELLNLAQCAHKAIAVVNAVYLDKATAKTHAQAAELIGRHGIKTAESFIGLRKAYERAIAEGKAVSEKKGKEFTVATGELQALWSELNAIPITAKETANV
jgi:chromosome partitioning protein